MNDETHRVGFKRLSDATAEDVALIMADHKNDRAGVADAVLGSLAAMTGGNPPFNVSHLEHMLQTATLAHRAGADEETVVCALLHDLGDTLAPDNHGEFIAAILRPYVSAENAWMLTMHPRFQGYHYARHLGKDPNAREAFRGHPAFERTCRFCDDWDQVAFGAVEDALPLDAFRPMVQRLFAREPRHTALD